jgi:hypothetical protein
MATEKKSAAEMIGEFLRDIAILVLVFYPLDLKPLTPLDRKLIVLACLSFLTMGIIKERRRTS